jgi:hypothetical protein
MSRMTCEPRGSLTIDTLIIVETSCNSKSERRHVNTEEHIRRESKAIGAWPV